ncbi:monofunctional biosynthetic peptidoglycan transglycosylase [Pedomonas mirosovicensis]|uniref:monofunctional biosynthetic peptidoglycan transglycosylase n=1 Tax=Pedomonas mirosovicensis TaxID=2908641 RepID=UPI00216970AE|nr:monofunctional biosynthetic peptidoglycan transglycosylase [Pedomonas mirosovicensis]MCH8685598.1 monofunctional biosynthetic peptidoglycan transglycosylase [Pedomonas mirosovicensis]
MLKSFLARLFSWLIRAAVVWVALTCLWVLAYRWINPPVTSLMIRDWAAGETVRRDWVPIENISPRLAYAAMTAEDQNFCNHHGFDFEAISKAMKANMDGGRLRGGSTISQQVAKNAFLWPARSWARKALEAYFTVLIEAAWPKQRILEVYLNIVEWGKGVYGAEAASHYYYGKGAARLTRTEAARLASILPAPRRWSPDHLPRGVARKARAVRRVMPFVQREMSGCLQLP